MNRIFGKIRQSDFAKNVVIVFSGSLISQLMPIAAMPVLARLYSPSQYGIYGLYLSIASIIATLSTLKYTQAIQIAQTKEDSFLILRFCLLLVVGFSFVSLLLVIPIYFFAMDLLGIGKIGGSLLTVPLFIVIMGYNEVLLVWLNRNKNFKYISYNRVITTVFTLLVSIGWAIFIDNKFTGLIWGGLIGQFIGTVFLLYRSNKIKRFGGHYSFNRLKLLIKKFRSFPFYALPSDLINVITNQLPIFMLNRYATSIEIGYFNMSNRILGLPSLVISSSVGEVFKQKSTEEFHEKGNCLTIFDQTFKSLFIIGLFPFLIIALFGPWLFSIFLGSQWHEAGKFSQIFSLMFFLRFVISPLTYTFYIAGKQKLDFFGHLFMLTFTIIPFYLGFTWAKNTLVSLTGFAISYSSIYLIYYFYSRKFAKNQMSQSKKENS